jgi:hypothetical protein
MKMPPTNVGFSPAKKNIKPIVNTWIQPCENTLEIGLDDDFTAFHLNSVKGGSTSQKFAEPTDLFFWDRWSCLKIWQFQVLYTVYIYMGYASSWCCFCHLNCHFGVFSKNWDKAILIVWMLSLFEASQIAGDPGD